VVALLSSRKGREKWAPQMCATRFQAYSPARSRHGYLISLIGPASRHHTIERHDLRDEKDDL
jgi:hypothetical protein